MNIDELISDIDVLVNSVTNAGENWELDSHIYLVLFRVHCLSQRCPYNMNDLCKAGNDMTYQ